MKALFSTLFFIGITVNVTAQVKTTKVRVKDIPPIKVEKRAIANFNRETSPRKDTRNYVIVCDKKTRKEYKIPVTR